MLNVIMLSVTMVNVVVSLSGAFFSSSALQEKFHNAAFPRFKLLRISLCERLGQHLLIPLL
jgi:hypothetical protein